MPEWHCGGGGEWTRFFFICAGRFIARGTSELQIAAAPASKLVEQLFNQDS